MAEPLAPYAEIPIHPIGPRRFQDLGELSEFVIGEFNAWAWAYGQREQLPSWIKPAFAHCENVRGLLDALKKSPGDQNTKNQLISSLNGTWVQGGPCIYSKSPLGEFLNTVKNLYGDRTAVMAGWHILQPGANRGPNEFGAAIAALYLYGMMPNGRLEAHDRLFKELSDNFANSKAHWSDFVKKSEQDRQKLATDTADFVKERDNQLDELKQRFLRIYELKEPAAYWEKERDQHFWWGLFWGAATLLIGGAGGCFLYWLAKQPRELQADASFWTILPDLYPLLLVSVGLLWLLRIMVRSYLSHKHLQADAAERVVMTRTYLALREGHGERELDKEGLVIVLQQLFRHTVTGLIKDDAAPNLPATMVSKHME